MKKLVPWMKANWPSLAALFLALILAPVAMFFAARWRGSIHKSAEAKINEDISSLNAIDVTYEIQPYLTGQEPVSVKTVPNEASTQAVSRILEQVLSENALVRNAALAFNEDSLKPIIGGEGAGDQLFPQPGSDSQRLRLLSQMVAAWPEAHKDLLRRFHMGAPLPAELIVADLEQVRKQEVSRLDAGQPGRTLTPEELGEITRLLSERRLAKYRAEARRLTAYAEPDGFVGVTPWPATNVLPIEKAWEWQHLYWVHHEIIRALASANSTEAGNWRPVFDAPVKRVLSITVSEPSAAAAPAGGDHSGGGVGSENQPAGDEKAELARNFDLSHTGRSAWRATPNPIYDIRFVDLRLIVTAERIPEVLAAFPRTNFMAVVGLSFTEYDPSSDLREGFDYGAEPLVQAVIRVETVWLRGWMKKWMPPTVRKALGIPSDEPAGAGSGDSAPESSGTGSGA